MIVCCRARHYIHTAPGLLEWVGANNLRREGFAAAARSATDSYNQALAAVAFAAELRINEHYNAQFAELARTATMELEGLCLKANELARAVEAILCFVEAERTRDAMAAAARALDEDKAARQLRLPAARQAARAPASASAAASLPIVSADYLVLVHKGASILAA